MAAPTSTDPSYQNLPVTVPRPPPPIVPNPEKKEIHARMVEHMGVIYFVVFKDETLVLITDVWMRDFRCKDYRRCIWSHRWNKKPTGRIKNICKKALLAPLAQ